MLGKWVCCFKIFKRTSFAYLVLQLRTVFKLSKPELCKIINDKYREIKIQGKEITDEDRKVAYGLTGKNIDESQQDFEGKGYGDFKGAVADVVVDYLKPVRDKANKLLQDETHLNKLLAIGAEKANAVASKTLKDTYNALGLISRG